MSPRPQPPLRRLTKYNVCPSRLIVGQKSSAVELTGAPMFTGSPHSSSALVRVETQMSRPPKPLDPSDAVLDRLDAMKKVRPSGAEKGHPSLAVVLKSMCVPGID